MGEGLEPGQEESTVVENPELAHEMAKAEDPWREKIALAKEMELSDEDIQRLELISNSYAEAKEAKYSSAMEAASKIVREALIGGSVNIDEFMEERGSIGVEELQQALKQRLTVKNEQSGTFVLRDDFRLTNNDSLHYGTLEYVARPKKE